MVRWRLPIPALDSPGPDEDDGTDDRTRAERRNEFARPTRNIGAQNPPKAKSNRKSPTARSRPIKSLTMDGLSTRNPSNDEKPVDEN